MAAAAPAAAAAAAAAAADTDAASTNASFVSAVSTQVDADVAGEEPIVGSGGDDPEVVLELGDETLVPEGVPQMYVRVFCFIYINN
jgi:hypothetical protein